MIALPHATGLLLLGWVRWRLLRAGAAALRRTPLKLTVILSVWSLLLVGLYLLAHQGIRFLYETAGVGAFLLDRLWYLFLFVVSILLGVSQLASGYSTLVRAPETTWWMSFPLSARTLCRAKWVESSFYSAWAVVVLVAPVAGAYLMVLHRSVWLAGWLVILLLPLLAIVTALSTIVLLVWLRWCGRIAVRREVVAVGFVAACAVLFWLLGEQPGEQPHDAWFVALQELLPRMQIAMSPGFPSSWVAKALSAGLNSQWVEGGVYAALLWTTAAMTWRLLDHAAAVLLFPVLKSRDDSVTRGRRDEDAAAKVNMGWWMQHPFRALLVKDLLLVVRDPMQWSQAVVFFGLLGAYFANIHRLAGVSVEPSWRIGVASLNLACTLLVFGSLAVRFIFPQMSLEGRRLWLLRLAPHGLQRLLLAKFCLYGTLAVLIIEGLLWLSASRLGVPLAIRWWLAGVGVMAALTIVGLTVGLGAWWIDPSAQDAARVVSSSSGALALVLVLAYVGCVVAALVVGWSGWAAGSPSGFIGASLGLIAVSALAGWLSVRRGLARIEQLDDFR